MDMEVQYQQRSMPAVGVARGVGVGAGQGLTGASMPRTPLSVVQRLEQRVTEQSPPSVGSPEWSRGAAQEKRQQQERVKDNEALREAANSPSRSNGSSDGSNSNGSGSYIGSSSSSSSGGDEVVQGRVESRYTRQKTAAAREAAAEKSTGGSSVAGPATTTDSVHVFLLESVHLFSLSSQCRKRSESSQSAVRSHDLCCRLVATRAPQSSGRHYRMRLHLDWW